MMTGYQAYVLFLALTRHFNSSYDFFKYNGKVKANVNSFEKTKGKFFYEKLAKKRNVKGFILANIIAKNCSWVGDLFNEEAEKNFIRWERVNDSITYVFSNEISQLIGSAADNLMPKNGSSPRIVELFVQNKISIETLAIFVDLFNLDSKWRVFSNPLIDDILSVVLKYIPFIQYDRKTIKQIVVNHWRN